VASGDTALYDVVVGAASHFTPTVENKVLVVLSDGKDEGSSASWTKPSRQRRASGRDDQPDHCADRSREPHRARPGHVGR
jgi:hypothetical protein